MFDFFKKKEVVEDEFTKYENELLNTFEDITDKYNEKYNDKEKELFDLYGECEKVTNTVKLLVISDTNGILDELKFADYIYRHQDYDVCILLGNHKENDMEIILKYVNNRKIFGIRGNYDSTYLQDNNIRDLNGKMITVNGVTMMGMEGTYKYSNAEFPSFTQKQSIEFVVNKPKVNILLSYDHGFNQNARMDTENQGLFGITYYLYKNKVAYHIHAHNKASKQSTMMNGTKEICTYQFEYLELPIKEE
ncbi:MAG: hypothetical protein IKR57_04685 [Bacilli bacterium]|nr:hypothetical protein [Bacilli bacterium]